MSRVIIIGMGASGMMAACLAAKNHHEVIIIDKNEKPGKKLFITGKGRCNLTNACESDEFFRNIVNNSKFVISAFRRFNNMDTIDFFNNIGLHTKVERGNRVFPVSDHSSDVIKVLKECMELFGVRIMLNTTVIDVNVDNSEFKSIITESGEIIEADQCIIATGGLSYPSTGSTGDGYRFAKKIGHTIVSTSPSLVPIYVAEHFIKELEGLSLKNVTLTVSSKDKILFSELGEMLFTSSGISGPLVISASAYVNKYFENREKLFISIDLKPALSEEQLDQRLLRDFESMQNKLFKNALDKLLPQSMINVMITLSRISPDKKINSITKEERNRLVMLLKEMKLTPIRLGDYREAVITRGGINVKEINPRTMESKIAHGVFFIGEVLDIDALTGGFNLQLAWSTAAAAASGL